jgi:hypothetical protein
MKCKFNIGDITSINGGFSHRRICSAVHERAPKSTTKICI